MGYGPHGLWKNTFHYQKTSGYLGNIPEKWADLIGAKYYTGLTVLQGTGTASLGPAFYTFNFDSQNPPGATGSLSTRELLVHGGLDFPFNWTSLVTSSVIVGDYVYFFGVRGTGQTWYGLGVEEIDGITYKDPIYPIRKGYHAENYEAAYWIYSMSDIADVAAGRKSRLDVRPYRGGKLDDLLDLPLGSIPGGVAYDIQKNRLYLSIPVKITNRYETEPMIYVFEGVTPHSPEPSPTVVATPTPIPTVIPAPTLLPAPSTTPDVTEELSPSPEIDPSTGKPRKICRPKKWTR